MRVSRFESKISCRLSESKPLLVLALDGLGCVILPSIPGPQYLMVQNCGSEIWQVNNSSLKHQNPLKMSLSIFRTVFSAHSFRGFLAIFFLNLHKNLGNS